MIKRDLVVLPLGFGHENPCNVYLNDFLPR